jgi:hypothetical protein
MKTQERKDLLNEASELINDAIGKIEEAVHDTGCESSADAYIIGHLSNWANGNNPHDETIPVLIEAMDDYCEDEDEPEPTVVIEDSPNTITLGNGENVDIEGYTQIVVWPGTVMDEAEGEHKKFEKWMKDHFAVSVKYLETIVTRAGAGGEGGRTDVFFVCKDEDVPKLVIPKLQLEMTWLEDAVANFGEIYPDRVREWNKF